jgi:dynein heavy chain 2, cytosolic
MNAALHVQAIEWLKSNLAGKQLQVVMQQDPSFVTSLELAVRFGKTLIVQVQPTCFMARFNSTLSQEVDQVIPMLYPILRRDLFRKDSRMVTYACFISEFLNEHFLITVITLIILRWYKSVKKPLTTTILSEYLWFVFNACNCFLFAL